MLHRTRKFTARRRVTRRGYSGLLPGVPCGTAVRGAISCHGGTCSPQQPCPEYEPCAPCPPWPDPEPCPPWPDPEPCPPQQPCPEYEPCAPRPPWPDPEPCPECPPMDCAEACYTLYGDTNAYDDCMAQNCGDRPIPPTRPPGLPPIMVANPPTRPPPGMPPIMVANPPSVPCAVACKLALGRGEISIEEAQACMDECCIENRIAEGHSPAYAARLCRDPQPTTRPPATPFTHVPAREPVYPVP